MRVTDHPVRHPIGGGIRRESQYRFAAAEIFADHRQQCRGAYPWRTADEGDFAPGDDRVDGVVFSPPGMFSIVYKRLSVGMTVDMTINILIGIIK